MTCDSCQSEAVWRATGKWPSNDARNRWALWGCTCTPEAAKEANDFINLVTR